ncbi:MAG: HD domain-containing protein [bacterium]
MIVNKPLLQELFRAFHIQRWNDRVRPMELLEMDKHAHKMIIAYCLAKYEEDEGKKVNWHAIIKGGIYELLRRITLSDMKSPIYNKIKKNKPVFSRLNKYVFNELEQIIQSEEIKNEIKLYLQNEICEDNLSKRILEAAHIFSSYWEFRIIKLSNPPSYQNIKIETELLNTLDSYKDLAGVSKLTQMHTITNFVDLFGHLRFQIRWAQLPRVPKTSVLGHSLMVACTAYFFARDNDACDKRLFNDFFGGLFHDLPEAVTRDIISPVKKSSKEFEKLIKDIEKELAEKEIYPLVEKHWRDEISYFISDEFDNKIIIKDKLNSDLSVDEINKKYNSDKYNPYDGQLVKAADCLAAFMEVWNSCRSGITTEELTSAARKIREDEQKIIGKINLKKLYEEFEEV